MLARGKGCFSLVLALTLMFSLFVRPSLGFVDEPKPPTVPAQKSKLLPRYQAVAQVDQRLISLSKKPEQNGAYSEFLTPPVLVVVKANGASQVDIALFEQPDIKGTIDMVSLVPYDVAEQEGSVAIELTKSGTAEFVQAKMQRGWIRLGLQNYDGAIRDFDSVIQYSDSLRARAYLYRAIALNQLEKWDAALDSLAYFFESGNQLTLRERYLGHWYRALCWLEKGDYQKALSDAKIAISKHPASAISRAQAFLLKGRALMGLEEWDKADAAFTAGLKEYPNSVNLLKRRAKLNRIRKNYAKTDADLQRALKIEPNHMELLFDVAWFYATCPNTNYQDAERARKAALTAYELSSKQTTSQFTTVAAALARAGKFQDAVNFQNAALKLEPNNSWIQRTLNLYASGQAFVEE